MVGEESWCFSLICGASDIRPDTFYDSYSRATYTYLADNHELELKSQKTESQCSILTRFSHQPSPLFPGFVFQLKRRCQRIRRLSTSPRTLRHTTTTSPTARRKTRSDLNVCEGACAGADGTATFFSCLPAWLGSPQPIGMTSSST